ncbi:hypothetical protein [Cohnella zeiphila]|uniref:hypothetical protein n=1 Tax=Cohnella zeiphila TaxID=2761120 RepID=UPI00308007EF
MKSKLRYRPPRRQVAYVSLLGTTQLHFRHPWVIAWWSTAFPGFGHLLLSKYLRGFLLIGWEILINSQSHLNTAMVYSFMGRFALAKETLDVRWMSLYAPVYLFAIYDSYRTTIDLNHVYTLANREKSYFQVFKIGTMEINYLDKRNPWLALAWSCLMPGMGQLYIHRIVTAFYLLTGWIGAVYMSHFLEGLHYSLLGDFHRATQVVDKGWLLFLPSMFGFGLYDAYTNTVENNKLFDQEQKRFLQSNYQRKKEDSMRIVSSFDHSTYLEMALTRLEEIGVRKEEILAVPLDRRETSPRMLDSLHRSDGVSLIDFGVACATALAVVGSSVGFLLEWGPVIWGIIGAFVGFGIGLAVDLSIGRKKTNRESRKKGTEVFVLVNCEEHQIELVEKILWRHMALGVARLA